MIPLMILPEGNLPQMARDLLDAFDYSELARRLRPWIAAVALGAVRLGLGSKILRYRPLAEVQLYEVTAGGLTAALGAAAAGDVVFIPAARLAGAFTVPGGVVVVGLGSGTVIEGTVTVGNGSEVGRLRIEAAGTGETAALVGPQAGTGRAWDCALSAASSAGKAGAVQVAGPGGLDVWGCELAATGAAGAFSVLVRGSGDVTLRGCKLLPAALVDGLGGWPPTEGGVYYSDQGMSLLPGTYAAGGGVFQLSGHDDTRRGFLLNGLYSTPNTSELLIDLGLVPTTGKLCIRYEGVFQQADSATFQRYYSDDGVTWTAYSSGWGYSGGWGTRELADAAGHRYWRVSSWPNSPARYQIYLGYLYLTGYNAADRYGRVFVSGCQGVTAGGEPLTGDRSAQDAAGYPALHANDTDSAAGSLHHTLGTGAGQAAAGDHAHGTGSAGVLAAWDAAPGRLKGSHVKDLVTGNFMASLSASLTADRSYTLQDSDMVLAALNLAQTWTQTQRINGSLGINTDPQTQLHVVSDGGGGAVLLSAYGGPANLTGARANGTLAAPTQPTSGQVLASVNGRCWNGTDGFVNSALYQLELDGTPEGGDTPGRVGLYLHRAGDAAGTAVNRWTLYSGGEIIQTPVHSETNTVRTVGTVRQRITTGTAAAGFGLRQLYQLRSSTTNDQSAAAVDVVWSTATHASRTADMVFSAVVNAVLGEVWRMTGAGRLDGKTCGLTEEGGFYVVVTAGEDLTRGEVVTVGAANGQAVKNGVNSDTPFGVVYGNAASGAEVKIVTNGIAYVLPEAGVTAARGYVIYSSDATAGRVDQSATIPAATQHWREIGHWLDAGTGAGAITRAVLHFN